MSNVNPPPAKRAKPAAEAGSDSEQDDDYDDDATVRRKQSAGAVMTFNILEETRAFVEACFNLPRPVENKTRKSWLLEFGLAEGNETKCPKMDTIVKNELSKDALEANRKLSRLQNFMLDTAGPLIDVYENMSGENPDPERVMQAIQVSLRILGNTSAHFSQERRVKAIGRLNTDLKSLIEDEDFSRAALFLFGSGFEKKAKERTEAVRCLRKATFAPKKGEPSSRKFFRGARFQEKSSYGSGSYSSRNSSQYRSWKKPSLQPKNGSSERKAGQ